jgi:hypothetical protein
MHNVSLGAFGNGDDVVSVLHRLVNLAVVAGALRGQDAGVEEESQVVDGDDRFAVTAKRWDEIGAMQHIQTPQRNLQGQRPLLQTVMAGCPERHSLEIRLVNDGLLVLAALQQDKLVFLVHLGQCLDQAQDVLPNPRLPVVDQSGVNTDAHL